MWFNHALEEFVRLEVDKLLRQNRPLKNDEIGAWLHELNPALVVNRGPTTHILLGFM